MGKTTLQKIQAFDINKELEKNMAKFSQNTLCVPVVASYTQLTKVVNALVGPVALMKKQIIAALDNNAVVDALVEANQVLDVLSANIGAPTLQVSAATMNDMNIFKRICTDFDDILPNAMKRLMDDASDAINDYVGSGMDSIFDFPDEIGSMIDGAILDLKEHAYSEALSEGVKTILTPLEMYRAYIKSSGILVMLKRLEKFERCLTNPKGCNRPKKDVYFPGTTKYNSKYYRDLFAINLKGEVQLSKLVGKTKGIETKLTKTLKKIDTYKTPIEKKKK